MLLVALVHLLLVIDDGGEVAARGIHAGGERAAPGIRDRAADGRLALVVMPEEALPCEAQLLGAHGRCRRRVDSKPGVRAGRAHVHSLLPDASTLAPIRSMMDLLDARLRKHEFRHYGGTGSRAFATPEALSDADRRRVGRLALAGDVR